MTMTAETKIETPKSVVIEAHRREVPKVKSTAGSSSEVETSKENKVTTMGIEPTTSGLEVHTFATELPSPDALLAGKSVCATNPIYS